MNSLDHAFFKAYSRQSAPSEQRQPQQRPASPVPEADHTVLHTPEGRQIRIDVPTVQSEVQRGLAGKPVAGVAPPQRQSLTQYRESQRTHHSDPGLSPPSARPTVPPVVAASAGPSAAASAPPRQTASASPSVYRPVSPAAFLAAAGRVAAAPAAAPQNRAPAAAPQNRAPVAAPQNRAPAVAPQNRAAVAAPQNRAAVAAPQNRAPVAAPQNHAPAFAPQNRAPAAAPQKPAVQTNTPSIAADAIYRHPAPAAPQPSETGFAADALYSYPPRTAAAPNAAPAAAPQHRIDKETLRRQAAQLASPHLAERNSPAAAPASPVKHDRPMSSDAGHNAPAARSAAAEEIIRRAEELRSRGAAAAIESANYERAVDRTPAPIATKASNSPPASAATVTQPKATPETPDTLAALGRKFRFDSAQTGGGAASLAVVQSLADYNPDTETARLFREAKESIELNRSRVDAKLAAATDAIHVPLQPAWEVDNFQWPLTVLDLLASQEPAFAQVAEHLVEANRQGLKVVAVTSAERGVGRSTTALCLAAAVANAGLQVAVFDADTENPSLLSQLNLDVERGWYSCIVDNVPLEEAAVHAIEEKVTLFPLNESVGRSEIDRHRLRINRLIKRVSQSFDLVIVDAHRVNQQFSQLVGTGHDGVVDAAMVVVDAELSVADRVQLTLQLLQESGLSSIGIVENFRLQAEHA